MSVDLLAMVRALDLTRDEKAEKDSIDESYALYQSPRVEQLKRDIAAIGEAAVAEVRKQLATCTPEVAQLLGTACRLIGKRAIATLPDWFEAALAGRVGAGELTEVAISLTSGEGRLSPARGDIARFAQALDRNPEGMGFASILAIEAAGPTSEAVPALLRAMGVDRLAFDAGRALARLGPDAREHVAALTEAARLRGGAPIYEALGAIGGPDVRKTLVEALGSPMGDIRIAAARGLGRCGTIDDAAALVAQLSKEIEAGPRKAAVEALARLRGLDASAHAELDRANPPGAAAPTLMDRLKSSDFNPCYDALREIGRMKTPPLEAIPILARLLRERGFDRSAVRALQAYGAAAAPALPALIEALSSADFEVRNDTARALGVIGLPEAGDALLAMFKAEKGPFAQESAIDSLAKLRYTESLLEALSRGGEDARGAVKRLLDLKAAYTHANRPAPQVVLDALSRAQS